MRDTEYNILKSLLQRIFRYLFWAVYFAVMITAFLPVKGELNKRYLGPESFHIRLDHLLHLFVYFLICLYFLLGQYIALTLFKTNSLLKFTLLVLFLGIVTELVQLWVPERTFNVFDMVSNVAGLAIGVGIIRLAQRRKGVTV
jgi:VanZ family protein